MAASGYTPIQLYRTTTAAAVPLTANLAPGELAINIANGDMALFAENASGTVTRLINNPAGLKYPTADGTANQVVQTNGSGVLSFAAAASGTVTSVAATVPSLLSISGSPITSSGTLAITYSGTALPVANGGTGVANNAAMTVTGSGNFAYTRTLTGTTNVTLPTTGTLAISNAAQTFTGGQRGAVTALTSSAAAIAINLATNNNFSYTTAENSTLSAPSNPVAGQSGVIVITQGATARTLAYNAFWKFAGGTVPTLTATASAVDSFAYYVESATRATCQLIKDVK